MEQLNLQQQQAEAVAAASTRIATVVVRQASQKPTILPSAPANSHPAPAVTSVKASLPSRQTTDESALMGSDDLAAGDGSFSAGFDGMVTAAACEGMTVMLQPTTEALLVDTTIPVTEVKELGSNDSILLLPSPLRSLKKSTESTDEWRHVKKASYITHYCCTHLQSCNPTYPSLYSPRHPKSKSCLISDAHIFLSK